MLGDIGRGGESKRKMLSRNLVWFWWWWGIRTSQIEGRLVHYVCRVEEPHPYRCTTPGPMSAIPVLLRVQPSEWWCRGCQCGMWNGGGGIVGCGEVVQQEAKKRRKEF